MKLFSRLARDVRLMLRRPPRQQYAALCYRLKKKQPVLEILVVTSRDTGRWIIPKGWPMPGKKAHAVAEREAYEEAGVKGKANKEAFGSYGYQKNLASGISVACRVQVHLLEVDDLLRNFPEKASRTLEWVSCQEAISRVREPELKSLIATFEKQMTPVRPLVEKKAAAG